MSGSNQFPRLQKFTSTSPHETLSNPHPESLQAASLWQRLRNRRLTPRKMLVYAASIALLVVADPVAMTFLVGALLVVLGLTIRIWTFGHLRKNAKLVTTGPYAYTRHPAYLGSTLILAGLFLAAGNPHTAPGQALWVAGVVGIGICFCIYLPRKFKREDRRLRRLFPKQSERHAAHVPGFFPRLTPWHSGDNSRFSWYCVNANHELVWPLACFIALGLMWVG